MNNIDPKIAFLKEADRLKTVDRANVLMDLSRQENSAEHSWHVALFAMVFGASDRAIAMILLHDLVEIDAGDQPIYEPHDAHALQLAERAAADRLFGMLPGGGALAALWREFETADTADAVMARRMDHIQPVFQVLMAPDPVPEHVQIARGMIRAGRVARFWQEWPEAMDQAQALLDGAPLPPGDLARRLRFLAEADGLKTVYRANLIADGSRRENSAEHSWHLALFALICGDLAGTGVDIGRVIRMLLLHDLVEIDVGDVPLHANGGQDHHSDDQQAAELAAARRLFGLLPADQGAEYLALWQEFEGAATPDALFAKALDRTQPVMLNIASGGIGWREFDVRYQDVEQRVAARINLAAPALWDHFQPQVRAMLRDRD